MKQNAKPAIFTSGELVLGGVGGLLLHRLLTVGLDERGLVPKGSPLMIILWVMTAVAALGAVFAARTSVLDKAGKLSGVGSLVLAAGLPTILMTSVSGPKILVLAHMAVLILAALAMAVQGVMRLMGKQTPFVLQVPVSVFAVLQVVLSYQMWCELPQAAEFFFGMGAGLCIMLFAHGLLERAADMKCRKFTVFAGVFGVFFAAAAAGQGSFSLYFIAAALWMVLELITLCPAGKD